MCVCVYVRVYLCKCRVAAWGMGCVVVIMVVMVVSGVEQFSNIASSLGTYCRWWLVELVRACVCVRACACVNAGRLPEYGGWGGDGSGDGSVQGTKIQQYCI